MVIILRYSQHGLMNNYLNKFIDVNQIYPFENDLLLLLFIKFRQLLIGKDKVG